MLYSSTAHFLRWVATVLTACGIETKKVERTVCFTSFVVATVLTACGIETPENGTSRTRSSVLQQCLPLAVLKHDNTVFIQETFLEVATVLTACGIETLVHTQLHGISFLIVATVLTACGIETPSTSWNSHCALVATVLTACGIETIHKSFLE